MNNPESQTDKSAIALIPRFREGAEDTPLSAARMNRIIDVLNAVARPTIQRGGSDGVFLAESGIVFQIAEDEAGGETTGGSSVSIYKISSTANLANNYIAAQPVTYDNANAETLGAAVNVAIPWQLRNGQYPTRSPEYASGQYILVASSETGVGVAVGGVQLTLVDLGVGRSSRIVRTFRITAITGNYLTCVEYNGSDIGSSVEVARPFKARAVASETLESISYTYGYGGLGLDGQRRTASWTVSGVNYSEYQRLTVAYAVNDIIVAAFVPYTGVTNVSWIDLNIDAREWASEN